MKAKNGVYSANTHDLNQWYADMQTQGESSNKLKDSEKPKFYTDVNFLKRLRDVVLSFDKSIQPKDFENIGKLFLSVNNDNLTRSGDKTYAVLSNFIIHVAHSRWKHSPTTIEELRNHVLAEDNIDIFSDIWKEVVNSRSRVDKNDIISYCNAIAEEVMTLESDKIISAMKVYISDYGTANNCSEFRRTTFDKIIECCDELKRIKESSTVNREEEPVFFLNDRSRRQHSVANTVNQTLAPGATLVTPSREFNMLISGCDDQYATTSGFDLGKTYLLGAPTGGGKSLTLIQLCEWIRRCNSEAARRITEVEGKKPIIAYITQENTVLETLGRFGRMFFPKSANGAPFNMKEFCRVAANSGRNPIDAMMNKFDEYLAMVPSDIEFVVIPKSAGSISTEYFKQLYDELDNMGYRLIVLAHDYIKTIKSKDSSIHEPRFLYEAISEEMKVFAKDKNVCLISAFQLNRKYAGRKNDAAKNKMLKDAAGTQQQAVRAFTPDPNKNLARQLSMDDVAESAALTHSADVVVMLCRENDIWTDDTGYTHRQMFVGYKNIKCRDGVSDRVCYFRYRSDGMSIYDDTEDAPHEIGRGRYVWMDEYRPDCCLDFLSGTSFNNGGPTVNQTPHECYEELVAKGELPKPEEKISQGGIDEFLKADLNETKNHETRNTNWNMEPSITQNMIAPEKKKGGSFFSVDRGNAINDKHVEPKPEPINPFKDARKKRAYKENSRKFNEFLNSPTPEVSVSPFSHSKEIRLEVPNIPVAANSYPVYTGMPVYAPSQSEPELAVPKVRLKFNHK